MSIRPQRVALLLLQLAALASLGCYTVPPGKSAIDTVSIEGAKDVDEDELRDRIITREASRFLGFVYAVEIFDQYALRRDLDRVERYMRARGFYEARVHVARVVPKKNKVHVTIEVAEGRPFTVQSMDIEGDDLASAKAKEDLRAAIAAVLPKDARLDEEKLDAAEKAAGRALREHGYAGARVDRSAEVDLASATAALRFVVTPGPVAHVGPLHFTGLDELPEDKVRDVFAVKEGDLYVGSQIDEARQALLDLGVFSAVDVTLDTRELDTKHIVPLNIVCDVGKLRTLLLGGGFEFDSLKTDVHGTTGWQSSNLFGNLRRFEVRLTPGVILYPTRFPEVQEPEKLLLEEKIVATLRQPAFLEGRTTGTARAEYNIYPVLLPGSTSQNVLGYHEVRGTVGLERKFNWARLFMNPTYGAQANVPFDYIGRTPDVETLLISYLDIFSYFDFRDDPIHPHKGFYVGNQLQLAGGPLQGDATDVRVQPEARFYVPFGKHLVLAMRGSVGFLFPVDYGRYAEINFRNPGSSRVEGSARDYQLLFFRGFFAGGPVSNRGYPRRGIGPYDLIPFLSPAGQSLSASGCNPSDSACSLPTGGRSLWEASTEVRYMIFGPFSVAGFCDAADVSPFSLDIRLDRPHLSCGGGGRYDTPVGPIRLDIGYRIPGLQFPGGSSFERPPDTLFGLPIALAFGIGEAY